MKQYHQFETNIGIISLFSGLQSQLAESTKGVLKTITTLLTNPYIGDGMFLMPPLLLLPSHYLSEF